MKFAWCSMPGNFCRIVEARSEKAARKKIIAAIAEFHYEGDLERAEDSFVEDSMIVPIEGDGSFDKWLARTRAS